MKKIFAFAVAAAVTGSLFGAEVLAPVKPADFKGYVNNLSVTENGLRISGKHKSINVTSAKMIDIDINKKYLVSCEYRVTPGGTSKSRLYIAPVSYDKDGKIISAVGQNCYPGTFTALAAAAKKGDTVIKVKNAAKWVVQWGFVAFNAKADFSDLPNYELVPFSAVKKNGDVWEITLKKPLDKAYPAGTAVREQRAGASYRYLSYGIPEKTEWVKVSRIVTGTKGETQKDSISSWRIGTAKAGLIIFVDGTPTDIELRNLRIEEVK